MSERIWACPSQMRSWINWITSIDPVFHLLSDKTYSPSFWILVIKKKKISKFCEGRVLPQHVGCWWFMLVLIFLSRRGGDFCLIYCLT